ncbi:MAG: potassium transporter TrkG [Phycisphaerales bacterium]
MDIVYKNKKLEHTLIFTNFAVTTLVIIVALAQLGFEQPLLSSKTMYAILIGSAIFFVADQFLRFLNARSKIDYIHTFWFGFVSIGVFFAIYYFSGLLWALNFYLLLKIIAKIARTIVNLAASGRSPAVTFVSSFIVIILIGAILLMLPKSRTTSSITFIDAVFTATSATCVTGLVVKDTGTDFSFIGQTIILCLIQLGGLGIVLFGTIFALMFGQTLGMRQTAAMQDLLSEQTSGMIAHFIRFIFATTITIEALGAVLMYNMWQSAGTLPPQIHSLWFCSIFHSISAFCNAGFGLFSDNLVRFKLSWQIYAIICPLIIFGGLGFSVLHNIIDFLWYKFKSFIIYLPRHHRHLIGFEKIQLQTKIVILMTLILDIGGIILLLIFQNNTSDFHLDVPDAFFHSVSSRTAGFNTTNIDALSPVSKIITIILMLIGGSPGGTSGGFKTVTLVIIIMAIYATIRRRTEVEMFQRSIPLSIVGKALTVVSMFVFVFLVSTFLLSITERHNNFDIMNIMFEVASGIGTVGLSTGITPSLTTAGKIIIIFTMFIGRLGPLTLLAALTFNIKPARYNYPTESVVVG